MDNREYVKVGGNLVVKEPGVIYTPEEISEMKNKVTDLQGQINDINAECESNRLSRVSKVQDEINSIQLLIDKAEELNVEIPE